MIPSGKRLRNYGKSQLFMGKSTISTGPCSIAMFDITRPGNLRCQSSCSQHNNCNVGWCIQHLWTSKIKQISHSNHIMSKKWCQTSGCCASVDAEGSLQFPRIPQEIPLGIAPAYSVLCQFLASNEVIS